MTTSKLNTDQNTSALWKLQLLRILQIIGFAATGIGGSNLTAIAAFLDPKTAAILTFIVGPGFLAAKPTLQLIGDWLDDGIINKSYSGLGVLLAMLTATSLLLPSCGAGLSFGGISTDKDSCHLLAYKDKNGKSYSYGPCTNELGKIDRLRSVWTNPEGIKVQFTYTLATKKGVVHYLGADGTWIEYSSKSGISLGNIPPQVEQLALQPTTSA